MLYHCKWSGTAMVVRKLGGTVHEMATTKMWVTKPRWRRKLNRLLGAVCIACLALAWLTACDIERRKSDAELGLNPQQATGRKIYDNYCDRCHRPYSTKGKKGPGLKGIFQNKYLPISGLPANDDRVGEIIRLGRKEMPGYSQTLSQQDIEDLLAYLHTL